MKKHLTALAIAAAIFQSHPAFAQEEPATPRTRVLDTVVVTADRAKEPLREASQNITVIGAEEIANSAADSVVDLLKRHGIQTYWVGSSSYGNQGVVMRGGRSSMHGFDLAGDVLLLVDGRRAGTDFFSAFGLNNIERIEIVRGPGSVQYGAAAIGGVINVITKRGKEKPEISLEAGYGSFDERRLKAFASARAGQFDIAAWGSHFAAGNPDDGKHRTLGNSGLDNRDHYGFNAGWNFTDKDRVGVSFSGMTGHKQELGPTSSNSYANQYQNRDYWLLDVVYEGATRGDSLSWLVRYYFGETGYELNRESRRRTGVLAYGYGQRAQYSNNTNKIQGGQAQLTFAGVDRFKLIGGVDVLHYDLNQNQPAGIHTEARYGSHSTSDYLNIGTFLTGKLYLLEKKNLVLSAGARYDYFKVNIDSDIGYGTPTARTSSTSSRVNSFIPSFGISYSPWDFIKLRSNYGSAFKMPTPRELGAVFSMGTSSIFVGNPDLSPEKSRTWDIGFDLEYEALNLSFTYFDTRYKDKIDALPAGSVPGRPNDRPYFNLDRAFIEGMEASLRYDIGRQFDWPVRLEPYISLTHLNSFRDQDHTPLTDIAQDSIAWGVNFDYPGIGLSSSLDFVYFDKRIDSIANNGDKTYTPGRITVIDFTLTQRLWEFEHGGELKLKLAVKNLSDEYYTTDAFDYMPGRSFYAALLYNF
ncbi:MAG: TonB-dependent receptor [Desulfovibrio sp.]|jgi:vitamin B12 transporter|nr:TonB-dependent receptor [Desulfovibrio sp.]